MKIAKTIMFLGLGLYFFCASFFVLVSIVKVGTQIDRIGNEAVLTLQSIRNTTALVNQYTTSALEALNSPRNQKALQAGLEVAATAKGSLLLVNRQLIPRAMKTLDSLNESISSVNVMVRNTDREINTSVLPETAATLQELQLTLQTAQDETRTGVKAITSLLEDPSLSASLAGLASSTRHLDETMANLSEASKQLPSVAADIEKISHTTAKYRKAILLSQILSAISRAFF